MSHLDYFGDPEADTILQDTLEAWGVISELRVILDLASTSAEKHGHCLPDALQELEDHNLQLDKELREAGKQKRVKRIPHPKQLLRTLPLYCKDPKKVLTHWFKKKQSKKQPKQAMPASSLPDATKGS